MNFTKFGKSGPNLQRLYFEKFEKRRSGSRWFWVVGSKDNPGELVWGQNSNAIGHLLWKALRLQIIFRIELRRKIIRIKIQNQFGLVGTENLGWSQGVGEVLEGFYHMGKNAKSWVVFKIWKSQVFIEFLFKRKILNSQNKFEREPTKKKFQKIKHHSLNKNKNLAKEKEVF